MINGTKNRKEVHQMGKFILRVNMSDLTVKKEAVPEKYRVLGGRAFNFHNHCR